jgi:hypothetical protein
MTANLLRASVLVLLLPSAVGAHRLDEYLQATRLEVTRDGVSVEMDLTPGVSVAGEIAARIDGNRDGAIAPDEAEAYGRRVVSDLDLSVNGRDADLALTSVEAPTVEEMIAGVGTIRLVARARASGDWLGRLRVRFRNNHAEAGSVYLANPLRTADRGLVLDGQRRDVRQREIALDYSTRPGSSGAVGGLAVGLVLALAWMRSR